MIDLRHLLDKESYLKFLEDLAYGKYPVYEVEDWVNWFGGNRRKLAGILRSIGRILLKNHRTVLYPLDIVPVPRYPFTKQPMIKWSDLQKKDPNDQEVLELKELCARLGNLINVGFVLRRFVLIDIDGKPDKIRPYVHIETKRGYHILLYTPKHECLGFSLGGAVSDKLVVKCNNISVEIMSGPRFLGSYPLQSRYLEFTNGKVNVRSYKIIQTDVDYAFRSADLTLLERSIDEVRDTIELILCELGCQDLAERIKIEELDPNKVLSSTDTVSAPASRFNASAINLLGGMSYSEFKDVLSRFYDLLPRCFRHALFGEISKGHRWYHLRLLISVIPYFVALDNHNLEEMLNDFAARTKSSRGDLRKWLYDTKYFAGKTSLEDKEILVPSKLGIPEEAWQDFEFLGHCQYCPLRDRCLGRKGSERRRQIVKYIETLIQSYTG